MMMEGLVGLRCAMARIVGLSVVRRRIRRRKMDENESLFLFPRENRPVAALGIRYGLSCHGVCLSPKRSTSTYATEYRHCCYDAGKEKFMKLLDSSWICFLYGNC